MSEWISVKDKLPPILEEVWLCREYGSDHMHRRRQDAGIRLDDKTWRTRDGKVTRVTHWMPLPKLPEV